MKKNIYKSTITVMLCLLFFMQKDILADNTTTCASTSIYQETVLSKRKIPQYGNLGLIFYVQTHPEPGTQCFYSYDESSKCVSGSTCNLQLIPKGDPKCNDTFGCTTSPDCPNEFTSTSDQNDTAWTFEVADIADQLPPALNPKLQAVIWDPRVQPEISTNMGYHTPVQNKTQMPTIKLAYDTKSTQQITMLDNIPGGTEYSGQCYYSCNTDECGQIIYFFSNPADPNSITVKTNTKDSTGSSPQSCSYKYSLDNGLTPTDSGNKCINHPHSTTNPNDPLQVIKLPQENYYYSIEVSTNRDPVFKDYGYIRPIIITSKPTKQLNDIWLALGEDTATHNTQDASR